jgi:Bacteriophage lambda head decoration protein D
MAALVQTPPAANFIIWEEDANYSRSNVVIAASQDIQPGEVLSAITTAGPTLGQYQVWAAGASGAIGIAIYGTKTGVGETAAVAVLSRMAIVNGKQLVWPAGASNADKTAGSAALAAAGIQVR